MPIARYWLIDSFVLGVRALGVLAMFQAVGGYVFLHLVERELDVTAAYIHHSCAGRHRSPPSPDPFALD